jgi:Predicted amidohydrolase
MKWNVALLQMDIAFGQPEKNVEAIRNFVNQLQSSDERPDVVLLPELWDTGYDLKRLDEIADKNGERAKQLLSDAAEKLQAHVIGGSVAENRDGRMYNTTFVFDRSGKLAGSYSKAHLFRLMEEEKFLAAGDRPGV